MSDRTIRAVLTGSSIGAVKAFKEVENAATKAGGNSSKSISEAGGKITGTFKSMLGAGVALGAVYVGFSGIKSLLTGSIKAFGDQQTATVLLNQAMKDTGQKWTPALQDQLSKTSDSMLAFGDTSATVDNSLQQLVLRGVPLKSAMGDLAIIANIAAAKHMDLASAVEMVTKATAGRLSPALKELGATTLPKGVTGVAALNRILGQVAPAVAGAAPAVSKTMPGALAALGATITDKVMKPLGAFVNKGLIAVSGWISNHHKDIDKVLGGAMTVLGIAVNIVGGFMGTLVGILGTLSKNHLLVPMIETIVASFVIWKGIAVGGWIQGMMVKIAGPGVAVGLYSVAAGVWAIAWPILAIAAVAASIVALFTVMTQGGGGAAKMLKAIRTAAGSDPGHPTAGSNGVTHLLPGRAAGGPVLAGQGYWVGENGPEPFYPNVSGTVAPTSGGGSPVGVTNVYIGPIYSNDGMAVVNALRKYSASNGSVPITVSRAHAIG